MCWKTHTIQTIFPFLSDLTYILALVYFKHSFTFVLSHPWWWCSIFVWKQHEYVVSWVDIGGIIQLSPLLECDPTVCLPEKSKVTLGFGRWWPNFSRGDKPSGHTPTRVIIGMWYRICLHQTPRNRIPAALRKYSI